MRLAERAPWSIGCLVLAVPLAIGIAAATTTTTTPPAPIGHELPPVLGSAPSPAPALPHALDKPACHEPARTDGCRAAWTADLDAVLEANATTVARCMLRAKRVEPIDLRRVVVTVDIDRDGRFTDVALELPEHRHLRDCLTAVIRALAIPAPGCNTRARFTLLFD